jgi:Tol biopolymer transport system component
LGDDGELKESPAIDWNGESAKRKGRPRRWRRRILRLLIVALALVVIVGVTSAITLNAVGYDLTLTQLGWYRGLCVATPGPQRIFFWSGQLLLTDSNGSRVCSLGTRGYGASQAPFYITPDGKQIAAGYFYFMASSSGTGGIAQAVVSTVKQGGYVTYASSGQVDEAALGGQPFGWSPDGKYFALGAFGGLIVKRADGSTLHTFGLPPVEAAWSPNSQSLAILENVSGKYNLSLVSADGSSSHVLAQGVQLTNFPFVSWSPDGAYIAYGTRLGAIDQLNLVASDGSNPHVLTTYSDRSLSGTGAAPSWSPDGKHLAFTWIEPGTAPVISALPQIYVIGVDGSNLQRLTDTPDQNYSPVWSPDGKTIAFVSDRYNAQGLYLMDADGSNQRVVVSGYQIDDGSVGWLP